MHPSRPVSAAVLRRIAAAVSLWCLAAAGMAVGEWAPLIEAAPEPPGEAVWRGLGPLLERRVSADGTRSLLAAPRPFWTVYRDEDRDLVYRDYLWPLGFSRHRADGGFEFLFPALHTFDAAGGGTPADRWWVFPVFFTGHARADGQRYTGVFPLHGQICDLASYDSIRFTAFPLYLETERPGAHSRAFLWPLFSVTEGPRLEKRRMFPLFGFSRNARETRWFFLWPFGHRVTQHPDAAGSQGQGWFVLPFYGRYRRMDAEGQVVHRSWTMLWPFFSGERGPDRERLYAPWPFYRRDRVVDADQPAQSRHLWPLYGRQQRGEVETMSILWPIWISARSTHDGRAWRYTLLNPVYLSARQSEGDQETLRFTQVWPLWRREASPARVRHDVLALWPFRHGDAVERNYAPFWTIYSQERDAAQGRRHDLLWGLVQYRRTGDGAERTWAVTPLVRSHRTGTDYDVSCLGGLVGWGRQGGVPRRRCLWFIAW